MIVLLIDALGWELAQRSPGFAECLSHRRRLDTVLGFSSGALPTMFTGRMPRDHGRFLMYRRARGVDSPFRGFQLLGRLPRRVRESGMLTRALTRLVRRRGVRGYFNLYDVPRGLLAEFDLAERDDIFSPHGLPLHSLWDTLEQSGVAWEGRNWRTPETENIAWLERRAAERGSRGPRPELLFFYTADLDARLHAEGSRGAGVRAALGRYDALIKRLASDARAAGEEPWIYVVSDHGMVDVTATEDVMGRLERLEVLWPRDYIAFFDSTLARFWWKTPGAHDRVRAALEGARGRWLGEAELERESVAFEDHVYG